MTKFRYANSPLRFPVSRRPWYSEQAALAGASTTQLAPLTLAAMAASEPEYLAVAAAGGSGDGQLRLVGLGRAGRAPGAGGSLPIVHGGQIPKEA